jgi:hypothetical protein
VIIVGGAIGRGMGVNCCGLLSDKSTPGNKYNCMDLCNNNSNTYDCWIFRAFENEKLRKILGPVRKRVTSMEKRA